MRRVLRPIGHIRSRSAASMRPRSIERGKDLLDCDAAAGVNELRFNEAAVN